MLRILFQLKSTYPILNSLIRLMKFISTSGHVIFCLLYKDTTLHTAAEPAVRSAVKTLVSQRIDTIKAFFFAANKDKNSAQVPLASTSS